MDTTLDDTRSLSAIFDSADKAERAVSWLLNIGVRDSQIRQTAASSDGTIPAAAQRIAPKPRRGLFDSLVDMVMSDERSKEPGRKLGGAGPRRVTVLDVKAAMLDTVARILGDEGEIKVEKVDKNEAKVETGENRFETAEAKVEAAPAKVRAAPAKAEAKPRPTGLPEAATIKGLLGACLVDSDSGVVLASEGSGIIDLDCLATLDTEFLRMWRRTIDQFDLHDRVEEMDEFLMTLHTQIHLLRPLERNRSMFLFVALDKGSCNLGMARLQLKSIEAGLHV